MCTVVNVERLVVRREARGLLGIGIAIAWSGVVLLGLATLVPGGVSLPADHALSWTLIAGGVLVGIGSTINGGCFVGSIVRAGAGNLNFVATLAGIGLGMRALEMLSPQAQHVAGPGPGLSLRIAALLFFVVAGVAAIVPTIRRIGTGSRRERGSLPRALALAAAGLLAGLMFARSPGWTYSVAIEELAHASTRSIDWPALSAPVALFAGAVVGARAAGRLRLQWPTLAPSARCLAGGALMGAGAVMIPGGNDTLLLWSIPGITLYGSVAYAVMATTIAITIKVMPR